MSSTAAPGAKRPTMRQVADAAGVSTMTVSYVFSRPERVSVETADRVRAAAERLGYPGPHPAARSLRRGRIGTIGVVLGERLTYAFDDPQAARFLAGVAGACATEGVGITLVPITGETTDVARVAESVVDGFIVWTTSDDDPVLDAVAGTGLPAVVHAGPHGRGLRVVGIDDRAAAAEIGRIAFAGARRPVVLGFPLDRNRRRLLTSAPTVGDVSFPVTRHRWEGLRQAWQTQGGDVEDLRLAACPGNDASFGERWVAELLDSDDPPDAIAAMSDELALGALRALSTAGVEVPQSVAVTGWDDSDAAANAGLTTLSQSLRDQGARCARLVLDPSAEPRPEQPSQWRVVVRTTTRPT